MKVSVITIVYNNAETVAHAMQSVLAQDYPDIEYIIVDGNSTDGTQKIIEAHADQIDRFISEEDEGLYDAINKGVSLATGDVIGLLHADDFYTRNDIISRVVDAMTKKNVDSVYGDLCYVDKHNTNKIVRHWKSGDFKRERFLRGWMPPHPTFFVKQWCYRRFGLYDTFFQRSADYELMLRMLYKYEVSTTYLPLVLVNMRVGGKSNINIKSRIMANREDFYAWQKNNLRPRFYTRFLKPMSKLVQYLPF